ncbi:phosphate ABC transporter permease subunit PstC [Leptolyngbya sp. FACHB-711]|uniref:phosphate ABC transporter permease subunit PstC n=1 Tax=unclassified Leptolyngbya TaxID=2650499 RepID=UPI00168774D7|nr:phosphate ABC transporter permease subunit PstC [Leptolyngbya sp. FACHB-711]MBD1849637.1 phosphate ABC transporter permease subunit PstC [Cyanobacteria bacterium FACHB-502]MBD2027976.1 phosphate ABC transporter permease subunit PstC [Leptolyngbya sp. FACHB-711]
MTSPSAAPEESLIQASSKFHATRLIDRIFYWLTLILAVGIGAVLVWITFSLLGIAFPAITQFGLGFLTQSVWNPVENAFGALPQIYGTIVSSILALLFAVPVGVGVAIFLSEDFLPRQILTPIAFLVELLAAIPSVVYGLWGIFVLIPAILPLLRGLHSVFGWIPFFSTPPSTRQMFVTALVLAIMILPTIIAISRDTLVSLPPQLRQGAYGLGATRWETILKVLLPAGLSGIIGSVMLALGRALGETMAAAMLIGNANRVNVSFFAPASTIAALIANQFGEASGLQRSSLFFAALVLMLLTLAVNILAEYIISRFQEVE